MERNRFDEELSREMQQLDESFTPYFDKEKVWRNSIGPRRKRFTYSAVAAAVIVLLLAYFIQPENTVEEKSHVSRASTLKVQKANINKDLKHKTASVRIYRSPEIERKIRSSTVKTKSTLPEATADIQTVKSPERLITTTEPMQLSVHDTAEFKVTFKRGRSVVTEPEVKVVYAKGRRPALKLKINPWADTTAYYVNENSYKRLNFKF